MKERRSLCMKGFHPRKQRITVEDFAAFAGRDSLIIVEALPALAAEPAGIDVLFEEGARAILRIAESFVENVQDRQADIQSNKIRERERAHRVVHPKLHDLVYGLLGRHPLV